MKPELFNNRFEMNDAVFLALLTAHKNKEKTYHGRANKKNENCKICKDPENPQEAQKPTGGGEHPRRDGWGHVVEGIDAHRLLRDVGPGGYCIKLYIFIMYRLTH